MQTERVRLDTWKEISAELRVSERTARRYEMREDLPVHRHMHERRESVYAWADELALWKQSRSASGGPRSHSPDDHWPADATQRLPLIGRDQQRNLLLRAVEAARLGHGSLVLIDGKPGIGKSHLIRVILGQAQRGGCFGMVCHCREMEGAPPYRPIHRDAGILRAGCPA
jgi:predicted AAA+ superfamily ATPase